MNWDLLHFLAGGVRLAVLIKIQEVLHISGAKRRAILLMLMFGSCGIISQACQMVFRFAV